MRSTVPAGRRTLKSWKSSLVFGIGCLPLVEVRDSRSESVQHHCCRILQLGVGRLRHDGLAGAHRVAHLLDDTERLFLKVSEELDFAKRDESAFQRRGLSDSWRVEIRRGRARCLP